MLSTEHYFAKGLKLYNQDKFDNAIQEFESITNDDIFYGLSLCFIGLCNFHMGNYNRSASAFSNAIDFCKNIKFIDKTPETEIIERDLNILLAEGYLHYYYFLTQVKLEKYDNAIQYFNKNIQISASNEDIKIKNYPMVWYNKGVSLGRLESNDKKERIENYKSSMNCFDKVIQDPSSSPVEKADALRNRCFAYFMTLFIDKDKKVKDFDQNCKDEVKNCFKDSINEYQGYYYLKNTKAYVLNVLGEYTKSMNIVDEILKENGDLAGAHRNKCYSLCMLDKFVEAEKSINEALKLDSKNTYAWNYNGYVLLQLAIQQEMGSSDKQRNVYLQEAIACFQKSIALKDNNSDAWNNKGVAILYLNENYDEAIGCFSKSIFYNKNLAESHNNLGYAKMRSMKEYNKEKIQEAENHFSKILDDLVFNSTIDPNVLADAYRNRGYAKGLLGKYEDSIKDFKNALECLDNGARKKYSADKSDTLRNLAFVQAKSAHNLSNLLKNPIDESKAAQIKERFHSAEKNYEEAINSEEHYALAHNSYGYFLVYFKENLADIFNNLDKQYLDLNDKNPKERYRKALRYFDNAIESHSALKINNTQNKGIDLAYPYYNKGYIYYLLGISELDVVESENYYKESIKNFDRALEISPNFSHAWNNKAVVLNLIGKHSESIENFNISSQFKSTQSVLEKPPDVFGSLISMSYALNALERFREAIEYCEKLEDEYKSIENEYHKEIEKGENKEKTEDLKRNVIEIKERYLDHIYYNKGYSYFYLKKYKSALNCFDKGYKISEKKPQEFILWQALTHYMLKDDNFIVAKKLFEKITLKALEDEKDFGLGLCFYGQKLYLEAKECFNKILDRHRNKEKNSIREKNGAYKAMISTCHYNLGCIFVKENHREQGIIEFEECLYENPDFTKARDALEKSKQSSSQNWFEWWTSEISDKMFKGHRLLFRKSVSAIKYLFLSVSVIMIFVGLLYPAIFFGQAITGLEKFSIESVGIIEIGAAIAIGLLLSVTMSKFRLAVIELEVETPKLPTRLESDLFVEFVQTRMPLQYEITSFRAPLQQPLSALPRDPIKPVVMPTEYITSQYKIILPQLNAVNFIKNL